MQGDLHTHTIHSDGGCTPRMVFARAKAEGLQALAITDHDYLPDPNRDRAFSEEFGICSIWGTEISAYDYARGRRVHILCFEPRDPEPIRALCEETTRLRQEAGLQMAELIAAQYPISVADVQRMAGVSGSIFKQHIMMALMQAGYSTEMYGPLWKELFDVNTGSCVRTCVQPDVRKTIDLVHEAGGLAGLAHPYTYRSRDLLAELLSEKRLDGIEVWQSKTTPEQEQTLAALAKDAGIMKTGGSDFHGQYGAKVSPVGKGRTPQESIELILAHRNR